MNESNLNETVTVKIRQAPEPHLARVYTRGDTVVMEKSLARLLETQGQVVVLD